MNKVLKVLSVILVVVVLVAGFVYTSYNEQNYTRQGHVEKESQFTYLFYDNATDNVFAFNSNDLIKNGTEVVVYMDTNNTISIYDDIIKDYKIIPWLYIC